MKEEDSLRGICHVDVEVRCLERPVHSGQRGGPVPDPVQILCRLIADLTTKDGSTLRVIGFESQPVRGAANQIVDAARARILMRAVPGMDPREAGERLIRKLTRNPPYRAHVEARIVRPRPAPP
jgi:acetylornithine deacetylase/succinyl-diaminopimelate desuccinylase-like protein